MAGRTIRNNASIYNRLCRSIGIRVYESIVPVSANAGHLFYQCPMLIRIDLSVVGVCQNGLYLILPAEILMNKRTTDLSSFYLVLLW